MQEEKCIYNHTCSLSNHLLTLSSYLLYSLRSEFESTISSMKLLWNRSILLLCFLVGIAYFSGVFNRGAYVPALPQHFSSKHSIQYNAPIPNHYVPNHRISMTPPNFGHVSYPRPLSVDTGGMSAPARSYQQQWAPFNGFTNRAVINTEVFPDKTNWDQHKYYSTIQTVYLNGEYFFVGRGYCGIAIFKYSGGVTSLVNQCGIAFADTNGWGEVDHYSTIRATAVGDSLYISGRGHCGMHIYKLVGTEIVPVSMCEVKFSDDEGWNYEKYYSTIQTTSAGGNLFIIGRGSCGIYIYQTWNDKIYEVNKCLIEFSDSYGWGKVEYYSTIKTVVLYGEIYIYGRASRGMLVYKTLADKKIQLVSDGDIAWSDSEGWNHEQYYSTIQAVADSNSIYFVARGYGGMVIQRLVGSTVLPVSSGDIKFSNKAGWGEARYYRTIGAAVVSDVLYIYGRGICGMHIYSVSPDGISTPIQICIPEWSDSYGWNRPQYYSTIQGTVGDTLTISGRSMYGMRLFKVTTA